MSATSGTSEARHLDHATGVVQGNALKEMKVALGVSFISAFFGLVGVGAFLFRFRLAQMLLGARVWFNIPATEADAMKVVFVALQSAQMIGISAITTCVGLYFALTKWNQAQREAGSAS